ncbi:ectonucleotide pyrophosphatase/phosphodiesterase family member 5-like isoform X2 [Cimex lectularius]|uniref:Ectonucleotide pyrophosphatase/phosphodiesterase n=1 Tax=Cimex lectularius TaxID=79782 RepID=A0A8I6RUL3_CIMLE|nr:ectonucleotide pyrophosphatase/phosphodiesterase family member 5-like isoform X2 [Cimex lectularius]
MARIAFVAIFLACFQHPFALPSGPNRNKLVVVSFDGFRFDFLDRNITPNINRVVSKSTVAQVVINVFPTQTFPNHFSISTGLYAENHGVLQSKVYDAERKKVLTYGYDLWHYDDSIVPIWILNEKLGGVSGVSMWPGSDFSYNNTKPTHFLLYNTSTPFKERVDVGISWMTDKRNPANLVLLYFEEPDRHEHAYGPNATQTNAQIRRVDDVAGYLMKKLKQNGLGDTNVIFLSDHGMESVAKNNIINLNDFVGSNAKMYGSSPVLQVYPVVGKEDEVFNVLDKKSKELKNFKVYKRNDIPDSFHYKKCRRAPPILALAEPKYAFQDLYENIKWYIEYFNVTGDGPFGVHGYDPETIKMHPYFLAIGPMFKENFRAPKIFTVDLFLLFARILNLDTSGIKQDGSFDRIESIVNSGALKLQNFALASHL